jgi:hypothetical protein
MTWSITTRANKILNNSYFCGTLILQQLTVMIGTGELT